MQQSVKNILKSPFFLLTFALQFIGWISFAVLGKEKLFFAINGYAGKFSDLFFFIATMLGEWPMIVFCLLFVFINFRKQSLKIAIAFIITGILAFVMKNYFFYEFARPAELFYNSPDLIHLSPYLKPRYWQSFPSGHTFAVFTGFTFLAILLKNRITQTVLFLLALLLGISRIYNGMHFPEDVLVGSLLGLINSFVIFVVLPPLKSLGGKKYE